MASKSSIRDNFMVIIEIMENLSAILAPDLSRLSDRVGLKMNMVNTSAMSNVHVVPTPVIVGGSTLKVVDDYNITGTNGLQLGRSKFKKGVTRRIRLGRQRSGSFAVSINSN